MNIRLTARRLACPHCRKRGVDPAPGDRQCQSCGFWLLADTCGDCGERIIWRSSSPPRPAAPCRQRCRDCGRLHA